MKKVFILFFLLGMITYTLLPKDIPVRDVRPVDVTRTWANSVSDESGCINVTQLKDTMLSHGEQITAETKEVCK